MYELTKTPFGKHTRFELRNPLTGHGFSIVPAAGANVLDIQFENQSILDGHTTPEALEAGKWGKSTVLFPFPNRLDEGKYTWLGKQYQFPINNAATGNAIHGFVREEAFEVEYVFLAKNFASIRCYFDYLGDRAYYPFPFSLEIEFSIHDTGKFEVQVEVNNLHHAPIPFGFGWHPYFRLTEGANHHGLQIPPCKKVSINKRMIPTGGRSKFDQFQALTFVEDTILDNCFQSSKASGSYQLMLEGSRRYLNMKAPVAQFPFFQVFTPPHRESIALEPMTCNVDAFNNKQGLVELAPDKKWKGKMSLEYRKG
ncbi:MAG: aldose 1-epimerase [Saprospiraceae bacterium]|nr:aldose 1-epimerase [Saprospiraceae bacterium]